MNSPTYCIAAGASRPKQQEAIVTVCNGEINQAYSGHRVYGNADETGLNWVNQCGVHRMTANGAGPKMFAPVALTRMTCEKVINVTVPELTLLSGKQSFRTMKARPHSRSIFTISA